MYIHVYTRIYVSATLFCVFCVYTTFIKVRTCIIANISSQEYIHTLSD